MRRYIERTRIFWAAIGMWLLISQGITTAAIAQVQQESQQEEGITFDFGEVESEQLETATREKPDVNGWLFAAPSLIFIALLIGFMQILRRRRDPATVQWIRADLSLLPDRFKVLITLPLVIYGFVHIFALFTVYLKTHVDWISAEEYFFYMKLAKLAASSHVHLFGHATMYTIVGFPFLFTRVPEKLKIAVLAMPIISAPLDVYSWWLIKFISAKFELISMVSGALFSLGFIVMAAATFYELWLRKPMAQQNMQQGGT